jgi:4-amino-4-deoxy-L-arabinose transferase-like glycosyltransferase
MGTSTESGSTATDPPAERASLPTRLRSLPRRIRTRLSGSRAAPVLEALERTLRDPLRVGAIVFVLAFALRVLWLNLPGRSLIFDEAYYVNAARVILGWPATSHYVDSTPFLDPNTEHPPLGKLLIAGSMLVFGDNGLGWRLPSVIAGMIALGAVWQIVRTLDRSAWLAVLVVTLTAFDNLTFVHGRIGTLDILVLAPMLVGSLLALRRRWILAGVAMGIALLIKITALYGIGAVLLYLLLTDGRRWWRSRKVPLLDLLAPAGFLVVTLGIAVGGLAALDAKFSAFPTPIAHIQRIFGYGVALQAPAASGRCTTEIDSRPWQWIFNECQITYLRIDVNVKSGDKVVQLVPQVDFRGALNPLLAGAIPLAGLFAGWYAWRTRNRLALWAVAWAAANYLPYIALALLTTRIMYLYYALPLVPAIAVAVALLLQRARLPGFVRWGYLVAYALGFAAYFPFRQVP